VPRDQVEPGKGRKWRRRVGVAVGVILVATVYTFRRPWFGGNFGVVEPGRVYRSAQPGAGLAGTIRAHQIKTVLNLRGGSTADAFYADEVNVTRQLGVDFYDLPMGATRRPTRRELLLLLDLFERCRYPLLIHCKSGADRTGLACGLYQMAGPGVGPSEALKAFTIDYGHVGLNGTERVHEPFLEYAAWLNDRHVPHSPRRLREWVETKYRGPDRRGAVTILREGPRASLARNQTEEEGALAPR
jgi:protein tyrosine phosphatase (PTP) superfamily phosphohydrolase (DUF442 family)